MKPRPRLGGTLVGSLLLLLLLARGGRSQLLEAQATLSGHALIVSQTYNDRPSASMLVVRTDAGQQVLVQTVDGSSIKGIRTGMEVEVTGMWQQASSSGGGGSSSGGGGLAAEGGGSGMAGAVFKAGGIRIAGGTAAGLAATAPAVGAAAAVSMRSIPADSGTGPSEVSNKPVATDVSTLIIPIAALDEDGDPCRGVAKPPLSRQELERVLLAEANPAGPTVASTFAQCSFGQALLSANNSAVADTVKLGCRGESSGVRWGFKSCEMADYQGWAQAAEVELRDAGFPVDSYKYRVYLIPAGACDFVGMGFNGCDGSPGFECRAWVTGGFWGQPNAILHEMLHNMWLGHAGLEASEGYFNEYADLSCAMGYCCANRCPNTPHAWQLGWITAQQLDGSRLEAGQTVLLRLPSQSATSAGSALRILPDWERRQDPIFLGLRTQEGGDSGVGDDVAGRVHIYTAAIEDAYSVADTTWRASLAAGGDWEHHKAGLILRLDSFLPDGAALVAVCRDSKKACAASLAQAKLESSYADVAHSSGGSSAGSADGNTTTDGVLEGGAGGPGEEMPQVAADADSSFNSTDTVAAGTNGTNASALSGGEAPPLDCSGPAGVGDPACVSPLRALLLLLLGLLGKAWARAE